MRKKIAIILLIAIVALTVSAWAVSEKWKLVIRLKGTVESQFRGKNRWEQIWQSRMLQDGDRARTMANSKARIKLADNSMVTLGQNTEVELSKYQVEKKSNITEIKLFFGKVRNRVTKAKGKKTRYRVKTPNAVLAARGTEFYVEYDNEQAGNGSGGVTKLIVFSDTVEMIVGDKSVLVHQGNSAMVGPSGNIVVNPPGLKAAPPGSPVTPGNPDIDLIEYDPTVYEATAHDVPHDPHAPSTSTAVSGDNPNTVQEGGSGPNVVPPLSETGNINVIIK